MQEEPIYTNDDRWITFGCGISLYNHSYDEKLIGNSPNEYFNQAYIDDFYEDKGTPKNNIVIFNFIVDDLKAEYERIKELNIGEVSVRQGFAIYQNLERAECQPDYIVDNLSELKGIF